MALELSQKTWKLGFTTGLGQEPRQRDIPGRAVVVLEAEIRAAKERFGLPAEARVVSCYEAGRDGFWLHRYLLSRGVENEVVDSSSIEVNRRQRRAKTDRLDVKKLLKMLVRYDQGERDVWRVVRAPSVEEEDARQLHRELETLRKEQTGHSNRIKGLLASCGLTIEVDRHFPKRWKGLRLWDGSTPPRNIRERRTTRRIMGT
jgi:transposase